MEKTKVIFRKEYNQYTKQWEVIALFPEFEASFGKIQCYTEEGWSECDINYYRHNTKKAIPEEYGKMYEYLKDIFEVNTNGDTPLQLEIVQKISTKMYDKLLNMWRKYMEN
jgi:transposase-like protein